MSRAVAEPVDRAPLRAGVLDAVPVAVAYVPFGLTVGAALATAGSSPWTAWASSPLLFGGAGQLLSVELLGSGVGAGLVVLAALVVNSRFLLYGASLAPHVAGWRRRWRWAGAYLLADPVYALAAGRYDRPDHGGGPRSRLAYYLGAGLTLWTAWQGLTAAGVLFAGVVPAGLPVDLAAPLTFLLLVLPMLTSWRSRVAAAMGAGTALAASGLPLGLGLLLGAAAGVTAGSLGGGRRA